jgi:hypothetical protein
MIALATQLLQMKTAAYLRPDPLPPMSDGGNGIGIPSPWMSNPTLSQLEHGLNQVTEGSHPDAAQVYKDKIHAHMAANRPPLMAELPTGPSAGEHFSNSARQLAAATPGALAAGAEMVGTGASRAGEIAGHMAAPVVSGIGQGISTGHDAVTKGYQKAVNPYHAGALSSHPSLSPQMQAMFKSMGK